MKLLITGAIKKDEQLFSTLKNMGHTITYVEDEREQLSIDCSSYEGVICNSLFLYTQIEKFTSLRYIQLTSAGYDRVPMDYVEKHNIEIHNARGVYSIPISEFVICGVLQLYKQSKFYYENQKAHKWEKNRDLLELNDKNVLIIGCGSVGKECAKRFKAFGTKVIGIDLKQVNEAFFDEIYDLSEIDNQLSKADVVVLTLPLTKETYHFINKERLKLLKNTCIIVNVSRGSIVDEKALVDCLPNLGGAVLDVFEEEPLSSDSPLWDMNNVIITPHNSFVSQNNSNRLNKLIIENLI